MSKMKEAMGFKLPIPSRERSIEIRIEDKSAKAVFAITVKALHSEMQGDCVDLQHKLTKAFIQLLAAIFRPKLPEISTEVVADDGKEH